MKRLSENRLKNNTFSTVDENIIPFDVITSAKEYISAVKLLSKHHDTSISVFQGAKKGNNTYALKQEAECLLVNEKLADMLKADKAKMTSNAIFCTLTTEHKKFCDCHSVDPTLEEVQRVSNQLKIFLKHIRDNFTSENIAYTWCLECHKDGGCHVHFILLFLDKEFNFFSDKNNFARSDFLRDMIKKQWKIGLVDVQGVMTKEHCFEYVMKEINKSQSAETAIHRMLHNQPLVKNDTNKVWLAFAVNKLREQGKIIRTFGKSEKTLKIDKNELLIKRAELIAEKKSEKHSALIINYEQLAISEIPIYSPVEKVALLSKRKEVESGLYFKNGYITDNSEFSYADNYLKKYGFTVTESDLEEIVKKMIELQSLEKQTAKTLLLYKSLEAKALKILSKKVA